MELKQNRTRAEQLLRWTTACSESVQHPMSSSEFYKPVSLSLGARRPIWYNSCPLWGSLPLKKLRYRRGTARRAVSKFVLFHELRELERFQTAKVTFRVIQGHWQWRHSIGHTWFPISLPLQLCLYLAPFPRSLISQNLEVTWLRTQPVCR